MVLVAETMIANLASEKCGELVKSIGDSWLLVFQEAKDAFAFMESLYTGLHKVNQQNPNHLDVIPCGVGLWATTEIRPTRHTRKDCQHRSRSRRRHRWSWEVLIAESALEQVKLEALLEPTSHIIGGEKISCWMPVKTE